MKFIWVVLTSLLYSSLSFGTCFERYYTQKHLDKNPQQEIRSVIIDNTNQHTHFLRDIINIEIHFVKTDTLGNKTTHIAQASGECKADTPGGNTGTCNFNNQGPKSATYQTINWKDYELRSDILFEVAKGFKYNDLTPGAKPGQKIQITEYDTTFKVYKNEIESDHDSEDCGKLIKTVGKTTIPRVWNEAILYSIRRDLPRPTVTARNLFHLSALMWDVYAAYDTNLKAYYYNDVEAPKTTNIKKSRDKALSFAAYTLLKKRYELAPGNGDIYPLTDGPGGNGVADLKITKLYERILKRSGYNLKDISNDPHAKFGHDLALKLLKDQLNDGSREAQNYAPEKSYVLKNDLIIDVSQSGMRAPVNLEELEKTYESFAIYYYRPTMIEKYYTGIEIPYGNLRNKVPLEAYTGPSIAEQIDIDSWVKLFIPGSIDQGGNSQVSAQEPLTVFWGLLPTFGDLEKYKSSTLKGVYFDPSKSLPKFSENPDEVIKQNLQVIEFSERLNPLDMSSYDFDRDGKPDQNPGFKMIDISPRTLGNSTLGTNDKKGLLTNPVTGRPYEKNMVKSADYHRTIAEFWADGPASETPPGHWNTLANYSLDQMKSLQTPFKWRGKGKALNRDEYELKVYLTLNGALHDSAVVAWGIKGHFQGNRPLTVIRKFADMAEKDPAFAKKLESFSPNIKMVTYKRSILLPDGTEIERNERKLAIKSWRGPRYGGFYESVDGDAELRDLSFRYRDETAKEENDSFGYEISGSGWILAEHWMPYQRQTFVTPPFPGFVSGHSTFSRAAAEVLAGVTGTEFFPGGLGVYEAPGLHFEYDDLKAFEFHWATYFDASDASGLSRLYGGIHASYDDLPARVIGSKIGKEAVLRADKIFMN